MTRAEQLGTIYKACVLANPSAKDRYEIGFSAIRLADVLLAIGDTAGDDSTPAEHNVEATVWKWDWRKDDLTEQSDETIRFVYDLLK